MNSRFSKCIKHVHDRFGFVHYLQHYDRKTVTSVISAKSVTKPINLSLFKMKDNTQ